MTIMQLKIILKNYIAAVIILLSLYLNNFIHSIQISTKCKQGKYYNPNSFECLNCPRNMEPRPDGNFKISKKL